MNDNNIHDAVLFSQIMFWHGNNKETNKPRMKIHKEGHLWIAKSYEEWEKETCIKERTIRKSLQRITDRNLIFSELWKFNNRPVLHVRVNPDGFKERLIEALKILNIDSELTQHVNSELTQHVNSITYTTTYNTNNYVSDACQQSQNEPTQIPLIEIPKPIKKERKKNIVYDTYIQLKKLEPTIQKGFCMKVIKELLTDNYNSEQIINCAEGLQSRQWWIDNDIKITPSQIKKHISEFAQPQNTDEYGNKKEILEDGTELIIFESEIKQESNIVVVE